MLLQIGDRGSAVRSVQEMLNVLGFKTRHTHGGAMVVEPLTADGIFGPNTETVVYDFQRSEGMLADGIVGPQTMRALEAAYVTRRLELDSPGPDALAAGGERFSLERMPADPYKDEGYSRVSLRADAAQAYGTVYDAVHAQGGLVTSSGGIRGLGAKVTQNRSATSFHYTGRALDLYIYSGMVDANIDPYVLEWNGERSFTVWARCSQDNLATADLPPETTVKNVSTYNNRHGQEQATGHFVNLTALFRDNGFEPIRARKRFFEGGSMMSAEWWHFQWTEGLVEGHSTFGGELLKLYRKETVEGTPPWQSRNRVYGVDWF